MEMLMANETRYSGPQGPAGPDRQPQHQQRDPEISHGGRAESPSGSQMSASIREAAGDAASLAKKEAHDVGDVAEEKGKLWHPGSRRGLSRAC